MALVKYGPLVQEVSGTVGGVTFARVHDGKACRGWRAPANKRTTSQVNRRSILAMASARWYDVLTAAQRADWDTYAATCEFTNPLGDPYYITGFNMFVRHQCLWYYFDGSFIDAAPLSTGFPTAQVANITLTHGTRVLTLDSFAPGIGANDYCAALIGALTRCTRTYPILTTIAMVACVHPAAYPYTLHTYDLCFGAAGDAAAVVQWYLCDEFRRWSKPTLDLVVCE